MDREDRNYVSVWFWMFAMVVMAIPVIGWIMIIVWAFVGDNASRKNYFRAILMWLLLFIALCAGLIFLGMWPQILKQIQDLKSHVHSS